MVPSYVVRLDEVPLTVNGKVDKDALPEVDFDSLVVEYVAPRTNDERLIVDAFELIVTTSGTVRSRTCSRCARSGRCGCPRRLPATPHAW